MSLITLIEPIDFGHVQNDPVKIILCLCSVDNNSHIKALSQLMKFISDEEVIKGLNKGDTSYVLNKLTDLSEE